MAPGNLAEHHPNDFCVLLAGPRVAWVAPRCLVLAIDVALVEPTFGNDLVQLASGLACPWRKMGSRA